MKKKNKNIKLNKYLKILAQGLRVAFGVAGNYNSLVVL